MKHIRIQGWVAGGILSAMNCKIIMLERQAKMMKAELKTFLKRKIK